MARAQSYKTLKFEDALRRLDEILAALERGEIGIEEALDRYEEAVRLAGHCRKILEAADQRIRKIRIEASGQLRSEPFETPDETTEPSGT